jgi:hypothetical protein
VTLGRSLAAAVYLGTTLIWVAAMGVAREFACYEGPCREGVVHSVDLSVVLAVIGLAVAAAAFFCSVFNRWLGLSLLALHAAVFAINLAIFWDMTGTTWKAIPPASLAAAFGYVALGGLPPRSTPGPTP